jgi:integrase/recombinase XerD
MRGSAKPAEPPPASWEEALDRFLTWLVAHERSRHTVRNYRLDLTIFARWYGEKFGEAPYLGLILHEELLEWKQSLKGMPATMNRRLASVRSFLFWASSQGFAAMVELPRPFRQQAPQIRWLNILEERALRRAFTRAGKAGHIALMEFFLNVGARIEEAQTTEWSAIQADARSGSVAIWGKGRKYRTVALNDRVRRALRAWKRERERQGLPLEGPVFVGERGPSRPAGFTRSL